jgi:hypothetical protein
MKCSWCWEDIGPDETAITINASTCAHTECAVRMISGSAAHQLHRCTCYGGTEEDPPGITAREAAKLAVETFDRLRAARQETVQ